MFSWTSLFGSTNEKGLRRVYLDYAGATPISPKAKEEFLNVLNLYGNPSAIHKEGEFASRALDKARAKLAKVLNAHAYEITFTSSGTESCNLAIFGTYEYFKKNCEDTTLIPHFITTLIEHPAVLEPIKSLEKEGKIKVTYLPVYEDGVVKLKDFKEALTEDTIFISIMYANNEIGTIQPVKEIGRYLEEWKKGRGLSHSSYPYLHIDACQAANYLPLDVLRLKCQLMTVNSSKVYGPKGVALLYKREGCGIEPLILGGGQERGIRSGTEAVALASSFSVALTEADEIKDIESKRLQELRDRFKAEIESWIRDVNFYGAWDVMKHTKESSYREVKRLPNNLNFRVPGIESEEMILRLDAKGFAVSHKSACASQESDGSHVIIALGKSEIEAKENIRMTLGRNTKWNELADALDAIIEIKNKYAK